jgi:hypothetical protein
LQKKPEGQQEAIVPTHRLHSPLGQAPHGEIQEPAGSGLHTESRTLLEHEGVSLQNDSEIANADSSGQVLKRCGETTWLADHSGS